MKETKVKYYVQREGKLHCYDVQLADDEENFKNIEHLIEHPEDIACTLVEIYSSADKCNLKIYDTAEECFKAFANESCVHTWMQNLDRLNKFVNQLPCLVCFPSINCL